VAAGEGERQQVPSIKHDENQVNSFIFFVHSYTFSISPSHFPSIQSV
jgi:hypothetical protein